jgi:hypothetical protein
MSLTISNTFHLATTADSLASSRVYWNSSFKAVLQNFASANAIPVSTNVQYEDGLTSAPEGMLYYNSSSGGMYINTTTYGSGPYGSFRRLGLGTRAYNTLAAASSDSAKLDPGELLVVINDTAGSPANNRVYLVSDSSKTLVDVGVPYFRSVANTTVVAKSLTGYEIADGTITAAHIADGTIIESDFADNSVTDAKLNSALVLLGLVL